MSDVRVISWLLHRKSSDLNSQNFPSVHVIMFIVPVRSNFPELQRDKNCTVMWKLNPFTPREPTSLEGRTIDISNVKVCVQNIIAEGGFSRVYLVRDAAYASRQYAMKHIICNDRKLLELVLKVITVMKLLRGHPNVVKLVAHTILDMGRTKEALLVMEFCDKSLVTVLENRGSGYFEEKQVLLIFRDVCNAVFAMHCQSPPIAHRDLKAENILLGSDGAWKLCDFGSTSTNHQCFDRPEERGIEEDNIRKYTTPAYRAPEMWDLYRREVISEKVDIWALGCLLYRICYLKLAFDGESKLQILNGNYRIPELPKYSASTTGLIKDMLEASPDARPDITQVWFRVNEQLPLDLQKHLPDGPTSAINKHLYTGKLHDEGVPKCTNLMPRRSPPPPPSSGEQVQTVSFQSPNSTANAGGTGPAGAFWSTRYAQESQVIDKDPGSLKNKESPQRNALRSDNGPSKDTGNGLQKVKSMQAETKATYQNEGFNTFIAEFDTSKLNMRTAGMNANDARPTKEEDEGEINRLKEQLKQSNLEKAEITAKYEKLSAICRSQRQEIQELKRVIATATQSSLGKESSKGQISPSNSHSVTLHREKLEGGLLELEQGMFANSYASPSPEPKPWQAFPEETQTHPTPQSNHYGSIQLPNGQQSTTRPTTIPSNFWPSNPDSRILSTPAGSQISRTSVPGNGSQRFGSYEDKKIHNTQPMGWAGF